MFTVVLNASSVGRGLATKYFTQIVTRYAKHDCVLLWELGNELNLQVNLPPPKCHPTAKCFGHKAMTAFTAEMVGIIRSIDPRRPISSGFSSPRAGAWHMEHCEIHGCPAGVAGGFWGPDTKEQWQEALAEQQKGTDYWSIHLYDGGTDCFFSPDRQACAPLTAVISAGATSVAFFVAALWLFCRSFSLVCFGLQRAARRGALALGSTLASTATGARTTRTQVNRNSDGLESARRALQVALIAASTGPTKEDQAFPSAAMTLQATEAKASPDGSAFDLSTIWAWMGASHRSDSVFIWPDSSDPKESGSQAMLEQLLQADAALAGSASGSGSCRCDFCRSFVAVMWLFCRSFSLLFLQRRAGGVLQHGQGEGAQPLRIEVLRGLRRQGAARAARRRLYRR